MQLLPLFLIGFTFNYDCVDYTTVSISNDGFIVFGNSISNSYTPLSSGTSNNVIAALSADLQGLSTGSLRSKTSGTSPNRTFTVEWRHYEEYWSTGDDYSFQIILHETTNVIEIYYTASTTVAGNDFQVGLRGASNSDYNNRTKASNINWTSSSAGTANTDVMTTGNNAGRNPHDKFTWTPTAPLCSGNPSGGTASATPATVCSGSTSLLDLSGYSTDCGVSYQWQSATAPGGPYSNIAGATSVPYTATVSGVTYYQCVSTCSNGGGTGTSSVVTVNMSPPSSCYCSSTFSNTTDEWITNVTFNTINNTTGQEGPNSYGDYTGLSTNIEQGSIYTISVTFNSSYTQDVFVWFDWNQDGDFDDTGEEFQIADNVSIPTTNSLNITVPATATLGSTRMRVMTYEFDDPGPCETGTYGETEDYTVNIQTSTTPMSFVSCTTTQPNIANVGQGSANNEIICIEVVTQGMLSPISATGFRIRTTGTTDVLNDVQNAKIWYTGTTSTFSTSNQFGTTVAVPPTSPTNMDIGGSQILQPGTNYFWLSYDIKSSATIGNLVDAECMIVQVSGNQTPTITTPAGNRPISAPVPVNDEPCGATALVVGYGSPSYQTGNLITTTTSSPGIPAPGCGSLGPDIWFTAVVPASGRLIVNTESNGGPTDMCMAWYASSTNDCNNIDVLIECDDDDAIDGLMPMICRTGVLCSVPGDCGQNATLTPGTTVYIRIWEYGGGTFGSFLIGAYEPSNPGLPSNCSNPTVINSLPYATSASTCCKNDDYTSSDGCGSSYQDGEDYVFEYTPSVNETIDITLTGTDDYTGVFVTDRCPNAGGVNCIASQTETSGNPLLCGVSLSAGTTYYIMIDTDPSPDCTPFNINISSSSTPTCNLNYTASSASYNWENYFGTNIVLPIDDRFCDAYIDIPFKFCYDGYQHTQLLVSSNGYIIFDPVGCSSNLPSTNAAPDTYSGYSISAAIPNTSNAPRNAILGPWHDINPAVGGAISYGILGTAPNRRMIISWIDAPLFGSSCGDLCTQQIKLYETTYDIEIHLKDKELCTGWNGGYAILGLHNFNGTNAVCPAGYNYPNTWSAHNEAWSFSCGCTSCITPLPVDILYFEGEKFSDNQIKLTWETASEDNNDYFDILRRNKRGDFIKIGQVKGNGTTNKNMKYSFNDFDFPDGINYYRLRQVDFNGQYKYSNIISVNDGSEVFNNNLFFPNPAKDYIFLFERQPYVIYTVEGKILLSGQSQKIDISSLSSGIYLIQVNGLYSKLFIE